MERSPLLVRTAVNSSVCSALTKRIGATNTDCNSAALQDHLVIRLEIQIVLVGNRDIVYGQAVLVESARHRNSSAPELLRGIR